MNRNAQAALEYLVTYGWGFVVVIIVIGGMAYFGFLEPGRYLPSRCDFGSQLQCVDFSLVDNSEFGNQGCVLIQFQNSFGDDVRIHRISTVGDTGRTHADPDYGVALQSCESIGGGLPAAATYEEIKKGEVSELFTVVVESGDQDIFFVGEDRHSIQLIVEFSRGVDGTPRHNLTGEIFATVAPYSS